MKRILLIVTILFTSLSLLAQQGDLKPIEERYSTGLFNDKNAYVLIPMEDLAAASSFSVFQYLQGRVPGLQIYGNPFSPFIRYRMGYPALYLNEMRVDANMLSTINMNDVAIIKVFRPPFLGGFGAGNGAIAVYTKDGSENV